MIVIPMAGLSSRFFSAGYTDPKYMLKINGETVFEHSVKSFAGYFNTDKFLFILRDVYNCKKFVTDYVCGMGIKDYEIIELSEETRGQAETVYMGLSRFESDFEIYIFNIDTFRHGYVKPGFVNECDGYLEVFKSPGDQWSFVEPGPNCSVMKTAEKERISNLCSDGLYYFRSKELFCSLFDEAVVDEEKVRGEFYIAPLYNRLIRRGGVVKYFEVGLDSLDFCGTPAEYENLMHNGMTRG